MKICPHKNACQSTCSWSGTQECTDPDLMTWRKLGGAPLASLDERVDVAWRLMNDGASVEDAALKAHVPLLQLRLSIAQANRK